MTVRLPVYPLSADKQAPERLERIASSVFGRERAELEERNGAAVAKADSITIEASRSGNGYWAADNAILWNPEERPSLPSSDETYSIAADLLESAELLPRFGPDEPFELVRLDPGKTIVASRRKGKQEHHQLDVQARYAVTVRNPANGGSDTVPVVGGGGNFNLTLGEKGRPIGFHGVWRPAAEAQLVEAIGPEEAGAQFKELTADLTVGDVRSFLAYYSAPVSAEQAVLVPVYVFGGTIEIGRRKLPMRLLTIPATEYGPVLSTLKPQAPRKKQPGKLKKALEAPRRSLALGNPFEGGTSWIGLSGGLAGSQANAQGFVDGLADDGWLINFNWGDANAWESDWRRNDDTWVDAADFVFYTGHADMNGWTLSSPDDGSLTFTEVGSGPQTPGDLWGQQDLEWAIVAACGPLQDELLSNGGGNVLARWDGAFDGLHSLMGYGAVTFDNTEEGKRVVKYAREGSPLIDSWFRTGREIQPSTNGVGAPDGPDVWVGAMYVVNSGANPRSDHLWGHGTVSADPTNPTVQVCMWTTC
jgi:Family of unknown function (DUF6345)